jgi:hypothetical protein
MKFSGSTRCCKYDNNDKPIYDLILGCKTMKELKNVLDFRTNKIIIDEIILPMRDISSLTTSKMEMA